VIFQDIIITVEVVTQLVLKSFMDFKVCPKQNRKKSIVKPDFNILTLWGFFDGASQGHPAEGGAGVVFYLNQTHCFHLKYAVGRESNNKEDIVALWVLLSLANRMGYQRLQGMGDSKLVIDWTKAVGCTEEERERERKREAQIFKNLRERERFGSLFYIIHKKYIF
jgi:ribonuclease HI